MRKILTLGAAAAVLCAVAVSAPASASDRTAGGIHNGKAVAQTDFSARRYRHYSRRYYGRRYYGGPYYASPYGYAYSPRYYGHRHYYRRPGISFGFGF